MNHSPCRTTSSVPRARAASGWLAALACLLLAAGGASPARAAGSEPSSSFRFVLQCRDDERIVGVEGRHTSTQLIQLGIVCENEAGVRRPLSRAGGNTGTAFSHDLGAARLTHARAYVEDSLVRGVAFQTSAQRGSPRFGGPGDEMLLMGDADAEVYGLWGSADDRIHRLEVLTRKAQVRTTRCCMPTGSWQRWPASYGR